MARRPRHPGSYARRGPQREAYDTVLIVCEGDTEKFYFEDLRHDLGLSSAHIHPRTVNATDPLNLVNHALTALRKKDGYDRAFCVFDRDCHTNFPQALNLVKDSPEGKRGMLQAIVSWPCFEVWILLHFIRTTRPFTKGDDVISNVIKHMPNYTKAARGLFAFLGENRLEAALSHARALVAANQKTGTNNPATNVHELVAYLQSLKR